MALRSKERVRRTHLYWHLVFFSLVLGAIYVVVHALAPVLTPVAAGLVLSYLLDPGVSWLERRFRMPRWLGALVLFLVGLVLLTAVVLLVVPTLVREVQAFGEALPGYAQRVREAVVPWVESTFRVRVPSTFGELMSGLGANLKVIASKAAAPLGGVAGQVARQTARLIATVGTLLLIPVFTFYFLPNFPAIVKGAENLIPRRYVGWVRETAGEVNRTLAAWIRGQLTVCLIQALLYAVGLSIAGIKMAVLIGVLTGLLAFIPYVGMGIGLTLALLLCLLDYSGPGQMLGVGIVFATVQITDGLLLTPQIVGERTGLGPVGVLLALMLGGSLFGFVGVLLAVPVAAALVIVLRRVLITYRASLFYQKHAEEHSRPPSPAEDA